jgi:hypothetical protein
VKAGRPLSDVISAANAALEGRYERQLAAGLLELCQRMQDASASASAGAGAEPSAGGSGSASKAAATPGGGSGAAPARSSSSMQPPADGAAGGGGGGSEGQGKGDVYGLVCVLRRLLLWPVSVRLLRDTKAGREVARLRQHPNAQVGLPSRSPGAAACSIAGVALVARRWTAALPAAPSTRQQR